MGGGFGVGIHNVPEAAVYGVPVLIGPNNRKFREAQDLLREGGCFGGDGCGHVHADDGPSAFRREVLGGAGTNCRTVYRAERRSVGSDFR